MLSNIAKLAITAAAAAATAAAAVAVYKRCTVDPVKARVKELEDRLMALNERRLKTTDPEQCAAIIEEMAAVAWEYGTALGEMMYAEAK